MPNETVLPIRTFHSTGKFIDTLKAGPCRLFWQTSLKHENKQQPSSLFLATQPHPVSQLVSTCKPERNQAIQSGDEYMYIPGPSTPREGWVSEYLAVYQLKCFCVGK